jgi:hypothetical protein
MIARLTAGALMVAALAVAAPATAEPGPPPVPPVPNPVYGEGGMDAPVGYLGEMWQSFHADNPLGALTAPPVPAPGAPPGAGSGPPLPPGTISMTAPETSTAPLQGEWLGPLPGMPPAPLAPPAPPS